MAKTLGMSTVVWSIDHMIKLEYMAKTLSVVVTSYDKIWIHG
jgi:hypothetical protein